MSPQFAWMYFLDVITSPVALASFGAGCLFADLTLVTAFVLCERALRARQRTEPLGATHIMPREWESTSINNRWINLEHRSSISPFYVRVVNEDTQNTETGYLTHDQARSLATWILDHLRGVPQ